MNHDTKWIRFKGRIVDLIMGNPVPFPSHVIIKDDSCQIARPYTPINYDKDSFDILVKKYPNGTLSRYLHDVEPGEVVYIRGPIQTLPYVSNMIPDLAMIAAGTGITPMYQMIKSILKDDQDKTRLHLVYANKSISDILLYQELKELQERYPDRLFVHHTIENASSEWNQYVGRVDLKMLSNCLPSSESCAILVCGPPGFMSHICGEKKDFQDQGPLKGLLKQLEYSQDQIYKL